MSGGDIQRHGDLLARSAAGDSVAFHQFYTETRELIFRYLAARVGRDDVDDLLADTYLRAYRYAHRFEDRGQPAVAWLVTIARNVAASHHRSRARIAIGNTGDNRLEAEVGESLVDRSDDAMMLEVLAGLKPRQRRILELRFFQERTVAECAAELSLTEQGVRALTYRALQAMRVKLGDEFLAGGGRAGGGRAPRGFDRPVGGVD